MSRVILVVGGHGLGWVLIYAGNVKVRLHWISFAATIEAYKLLPPDAVIFVARTLPWFEIVLGAMLVLTSIAAGGLYCYSYFRRSVMATSAARGTTITLAALSTVASALLLTFLAILVRSYALGMDIDCGCFGPGEKLSLRTLVRDGLLAAVSLAVTVGAFLVSRRQTRHSPAA